MSSSSRSRADRRPALVVALLVLACTLQWLSAVPASAAQLDVVAVVPAPGDRQVSLITDVDPAAVGSIRPDSFTVTAGGRRLPSHAVPVISSRLAVGLVVDPATDGAAPLQSGLSGATSFLLQMPVTARMAVVTASKPPAVMATLQPGASGAVDALTAVPAGERGSLADAIALALEQLPEAPDGPRLLLLYTSAPDAGGEAAAELSQRLQAAHVMLAVVSAGTETSYWSRVTADTGGALVTAQPSAVTPAFDNVAQILRSRYMVTCPLPEQLPSSVSVQVATASGILTADALVAGGPAASSGGGGGSALWVLAFGVLAIVIVVGAATLLGARTVSRSRSSGPPSEAQAVPGELAGAASLANGRWRAALTRAGPADDGSWSPDDRGLHGGEEEPASTDAAGGTGDDEPPTDQLSEDEDGPVQTDRAAEDESMYVRLDAQVGNAAADVADGRLDPRRAVAHIALAAHLRTDLLDRVTATEQQIAGIRVTDWPPTATVLQVLTAARRVASGEVALVGPAGVRVEHAAASGEGGAPGLLRLSRNGRKVCDCQTVDELARHVELSTLLEEPPAAR